MGDSNYSPGSQFWPGPDIAVGVHLRTEPRDGRFYFCLPLYLYLSLTVSLSTFQIRKGQREEGKNKGNEET